MTTRTFVITPIDREVARRLRETAGIVKVADESPGYPCRLCLRDAAVGDELVLVSYDPFEGWGGTSPYRSSSPIFLHRDDCSERLDSAPVPDQLTSRTLSVRAFDDDAMMLDARVVDGADLAAVIEEMVDRVGLDRIHVHNAGAGCFAAAIVPNP